MTRAAAQKLGGYEHFRALGSPRLICAPMVDASELAFRQLVRRYGVQLAYTPMLHAAQFAERERYRREFFSTCAGDRPLVAQFCGNDPDTLVRAAKHVEPWVDAVDLNLGCPQRIARRGRYGAFLQDEWVLVSRIVSALHAECAVPVWCKIRVYRGDARKTVAYARMLQDAGCQVLAVHGRSREQKGKAPGPADWSIVRAVKQALRIPVLCNGNVRCWADVERALEVTGCDGVLSAERLLAYPALFDGAPRCEPVPQVALAREYLECVRAYEPHTPARMIRSHLFWMLIDEGLRARPQLCESLGAARELADFERTVEELDAAAADDEGRRGAEAAADEAEAKAEAAKEVTADGLVCHYGHDGRQR